MRPFEQLSAEDQVIVTLAAKRAQTEFAQKHPTRAQTALSKGSVENMEDSIARNGNITQLGKKFRQAQQLHGVSPIFLYRSASICRP